MYSHCVLFWIDLGYILSASILPLNLINSSNGLFQSIVLCNTRALCYARSRCDFHETRVTIENHIIVALIVNEK